MSQTILRLSAVKNRTGLSRSTIYERMAAGSFPKPMFLGGPGTRAVGWLESEINLWVENLIKTHRKQRRV